MIRKELSVFLLVGSLTVLVDFLAYRALLAWSPLSVGLAKALGFIAGTVFAYVANRLWTFGHAAHPAGSFRRFVLLYAATLGANVAVNGLLLRHLPASAHLVQAAFVVATGVSATLNFAGMKFFVFPLPIARRLPMKLSLVIPCYNEAANLPLLLERCKAVAGPQSEVILVDNGSTDHSPEVLSSLLPAYPGCRSIRVERNQGYGFGILEGLRAARGEILAWTHADMQTDPQDALQGLALFERHGPALFVKGRRHGRPLADVLFTAGMGVFETALLRTPLWDINAQPTMFHRDFFARWKQPPHDFSLDLFAYYMAKTEGLPVRRFPVRFGERAHGVSHWNVNWAAKRKFIRRTVEFSLQLKRSIAP